MMILKNKFWLPILLIALVLINWAASLWHKRIDLTNEKRFTLSQATVQLLKKLKDPVTIDVFLKGNYPSGFRKLAGSTGDVLQEFKEIAGNKIIYRFLSPEDILPGTNVKYADTLKGIGLFPINLTSQVEEGQQQQFVYPFAMLHYGEQSMPVQLYQGKTPLISFQELNSAEAMLEYKLAHAVSGITQTKKPVLAYAVGNGEPEDFSTYDLVENVLKPNYTLFTFDPNKQPFVPKDFQVLMVVKPRNPFSEEAKLKFDQYLLNGGKIIWYIDRLEAEMDSLQIKNEVVAYDRNLGLNDLFFKYGARQNADLIMDLQCDFLPFDVNGNGQFDLLPWNYFPVFESKNNHPINKNLGFVSGRFVNSIDTIEAAGIKKTILLSSSANSRTISTPAMISGAENVNAPEDSRFTKKNIPVAVLLEGKFTSAYNNRLMQAQSDSLKKYNQVFAPKNLEATQMILVADGDMVLNSVVKAGQPIPMGMNPYTFGSQREFPFANKEFLQNCLDYLVNENNLSEAKAKDYVARLLDTKKLKEEKTTWQLVNILAPVLLITLFAFLFVFLRRRRYAKNEL